MTVSAALLSTRLHHLYFMTIKVMITDEIHKCTFWSEYISQSSPSGLGGCTSRLLPAIEFRTCSACEDPRFSLHNGFISFHSCWIMQAPKSLWEMLRHLSSQVHRESNCPRNIYAGIKPIPFLPVHPSSQEKKLLWSQLIEGTLSHPAIFTGNEKTEKCAF